MLSLSYHVTYCGVIFVSCHIVSQLLRHDTAVTNSMILSGRTVDSRHSWTRWLPLTSDPVDEVFLVGGHGQEVQHGVQGRHVLHHLSRLPQLVQAHLTCGRNVAGKAESTRPYCDRVDVGICLKCHLLCKQAAVISHIMVARSS